ncbi:MAG: hypothetical protein R3C56_37835 [Pirellulaceae bacterium]
MQLTESDLFFAENMILRELDQFVEQSEHAGSEPDFETWEIYRCWKEQQSDRYGAGTPAPSIPRSQRQFDGDNWFDYCESPRV